MDENVTAVVPVYNEGERILETIEALKRIERITQIIVVDDGSKDDTYERLRGCSQIELIKSNVNRGKGNAVTAALPHAKNRYVLLADGDLCSSALQLEKLTSYPQVEPNRMLVAVYPKPLKKGGFGLVKKLAGDSLYMLTGKRSSSVLSGQRLIYTDFLREMKLPDRFGLEFKITLEALRKDIVIVDIPLEITHRETGRDMRGFVHRGRQFANILKVVVRELLPWN
jgi:hypothetical protein